MQLLPAALAAAALSALAFAQQNPAPPAPGRGGRSGGFTQPTPSDWNDHEGWKQIFDGHTLENWHCDPEIWKVEDGMLTAKSTPEKPVGTTYCTWMGGEPADFELKAEIRMLIGGNSGIQYRSVPPPERADAGRGGRFGAPGGTPPTPPPVTTALQPVQPCQMQIPVLLPPAGRGGFGGGRGPGGPGGPGRGPNPYNIGGYQYDWEFAAQYPGNLYENGMPAGAPESATNRGIISYKGQVVHLLPEGKKETVGCTGDATDLRGVMNINGWNYIHIIARGPVLIHMLNGRLITLTIDDDPVRRKMSGRIAPQLEGIGEVYFRNLWLKTY